MLKPTSAIYWLNDLGHPSAGSTEETDLIRFCFKIKGEAKYTTFSTVPGTEYVRIHISCPYCRNKSGDFCCCSFCGQQLFNPTFHRLN